MHIQSIYVYPLKSVRPITLDSTAIHVIGPLHDRIFLLQQELPPAKPEDGPSYRNMQIARYPQLCLFFQEFLTSSSELLVRYIPPHPQESSELAIPLSPDTAGLIQREIVMYKSACMGYDMGDFYATFFTTCLGFTARLVYLGSSRRPVLGNLIPAASTASKVEISFADCAPLLVVTQTSLDALSERMTGGEKMDVTKLRPNIVLAADEDGELEAWEEDFWGEIKIDGYPVILTANCIRCNSLNVDYTTGGSVEPARQPLKLLMRDRRVDFGKPYSPVFGRYGFPPDLGDTGMVVHVGDKVVVSKRNKERTVFSWPGLAAGKKKP